MKLTTAALLLSLGRIGHGALLASITVSVALAQEAAEVATVWRSIEEAAIEGRGWRELASPYDRLPAEAESMVREPVWKLQRNSAGLCARFVTDAETIRARWSLTSESLDMPHMPASGVSGLDLYGRDERGVWRWVGAGRPAGREAESVLVSGLDGREREFMLYLPLYNGVTSVEIGLDGSASFRTGPERAPERSKPIVFYGTSITQGACASRPGMTHVAQLGRRLDRPVINLGFSGQGRMEAEIARLMGELDAALYVVDCLPNMGARAVAERTGPFVETLRAARSDVPILLVEDRTFANAAFRKARRQNHARTRAALRASFDALVEDGDTELAYSTGARLLGRDGESTVDGSHPSDLGFVRQADVLEPVVRDLIDQPAPLRVLLLGDSISIGYTPFVREALRGRAIVARPTRGPDDRAPANCQGTIHGVRHLERWLAQDGGGWDVIHLNFGLHDLKRVDPRTRRNSDDPGHPRQASPELYEANLRMIVDRLASTGAELILATTTPVPEGGVRPHRDPGDVARYNEIARRVAAEAGVAVNDLYGLISGDDRPLQRPVDVHFTPAGSRVLGEAVARSILEALHR